MKVLLIGNYENQRQQSMQRFAEMMRDGLTDAGHDVRLVHPQVWLGRLYGGETGLGKWIGYIDRFLLYPPLLRRQKRWADVVHICDQANAVYVPHLSDKQHLVTCHDMLAIRAAHGEIAESLVGWTGRVYQRWILRGLRKAQAVVCVSHKTAEDLQRVAGIPESRISVVPNALNYPYSPMPVVESESILSDIGMYPEWPFFIHVGGNDWYKNRSGVLRLFAHLSQDDAYNSHRLVMAGKPLTGEMRQLANDLNIKERIIELVEVSNEQLRALYSRAEALLFPSLSEGFGWPIIESQACECPVATTDRPPMNDVGGGGAIYIDPDDLKNSARRIVTELERREYWRAIGLNNAARFSRRSMIKGYLYCYSGCLKKAISPLNSNLT